LSINSVPVVALNTSVPLYRDLQQGDKGEDVLALATELNRLGYSIADPSKEYGSQTAKAVAALRKAIGDSSKDSNLPLSQVLWIPAPNVKVKESSAGLGAMVGPEEPVASVGGDLSSLAVVDPSRLSLDVGPMVMEWGDATAPIGADGMVTEAGFLTAVEGSAEYAAVRASEAPTSATAKVRLETSVSTLRVPPAAVFSVQNKQGCVQSQGEALAVKVVASEMNGTLVTPVNPDTPLPTTVDLGSAIQQGACHV
jgi:peptidoglycan hydrolase-like protein with peptidoglycan-binding domain